MAKMLGDLPLPEFFAPLVSLANIASLCKEYDIPFVIGDSGFRDLNHPDEPDINWTGKYLQLPVNKYLLDVKSWLSKACHEIAHFIVSSPDRRIYADFHLTSDPLYDGKPGYKTNHFSEMEEMRVIQLQLELIKAIKC